MHDAPADNAQLRDTCNTIGDLNMNYGCDWVTALGLIGTWPPRAGTLAAGDAL